MFGCVKVLFRLQLLRIRFCTLETYPFKLNFIFWEFILREIWLNKALCLKCSPVGFLFFLLSIYFQSSYRMYVLLHIFFNVFNYFADIFFLLLVDLNKVHDNVAKFIFSLLLIDFEILLKK